MAEEESVSDHGMNMVAAELSRAPGDAACVTRADERKTSKHPL